MGTVTALYDTRGAAETARDGLIGISIHEEDITIRGTDDPGRAVEQESKGFWASLGDLFMPDEDRSVYSEGMRRGGYLLVATVPEGMEREAEEIMDRSDPIDLDERSAGWRSEGWTGYDDAAAYGAGTAAVGAGAAGSSYAAADDDLRLRGDDAALSGTAGMSSLDRDVDLTGTRATGTTSADLGDTPAYGTTAAAGYGGDLAGDSRLGGTGDDQTLRLAKEELRVGKRDTAGGRVRVRTYVVERPVEAEVSLRDERVTIDRRPVDREVTAGDDAFQERTIEAVERSEEAVIDKVARVKEEIGLHRDVDSRTETVRDTVRETEVEIDDGRTGLRGGDRAI